MVSNKRVEWINCAKCIAILAVLMDHTYGILYTNVHVAISSYFSVSLFILISGYLSFGSIRRHSRSYWGTTFVSCKKIVIAYVVATVIYMLVKGEDLSLLAYSRHLIYFDSSGPLYYVSLYVQLMIISKPLYDGIALLAEKWNVKGEIVLGIIILFISYITTNYTIILNIYGGGGKLFGGTYLFIFYIGMLLAKHESFFERSTTQYVSIILLSSTLWLIVWHLICKRGFFIDSFLPYGEGVNPPSISLFLMALCVMFNCYAFFSLCGEIKLIRFGAKILAFVGSNTLYIFLYHRLVLDYVLVKFNSADYGFCKTIFYMAMMIFPALMIEKFVCYIRNRMNEWVNS